jgi:ComF family protein
VKESSLTVLRDWALALKNLLLPIFCKQCGIPLPTEENGFFCPQCWESSPRVRRPFCTRCGRPHPPLVGFGTESNFPCASCRATPNPEIRRVYGAAYYDGAIEMAVKLLKFNDRPRLAGPLGELMSDFAREEMDTASYDLLLPVPLHQVRERARGFNQSALLAHAIVSAFPNAHVGDALRRIRPTRAQSRLQGEDRVLNVRGAFAVVGDACVGKSVLLIDDVVTTTGTVTECARVLRRAGADSVDVIAAALAVPRWVG